MKTNNASDPRPGFGDRVTMGATLALLLLAGTVIAAPEVAPAPRVVTPVVVPIPDKQDIVVFAPHRPVRIRLEVKYEGKPIAEVWLNRLRTAFDLFDRDKSGTLNEKEVGNIFSDNGMSQMLQNGFYQPTPQDRPTIDRLDTDKDGKVSFAEYVAYYRISTGQVFRPQPPVAENPSNTATTEALFKLLDVNGDGKLTKDELRAAEKLLASRDTDEDECLSVTELVPNPNQQFVRGQVQLQPGQPAVPQPRVVDQTVNVHEAGRIPGTLTQQVIKKYDKDGDYELTREEVGFDEGTFVRLDANGNGRLDGEELDAWRTGPADFEVVLSMAPKAVDCVAKVVTPREVMADKGFSIKHVDKDRLVIRTGRQPIEFWARAVVLANQQQSLKASYQYLFTQAAGTKGYIEDKDLTGPNAVNFQFIRTLFDAADADGDGKMTKAEFEGYFDLQDSFRNLTLAITPTVQTPTLFQILDENQDGRLGVRELRTAWDRLIALEPGTGDVVTRAAILPSVSLQYTRGFDRFYINQVQYQNPNQNQVAVPQKGPAWFRKMDRNADGDVSRSEFLGTRAEFDAMDTDKDGLISLEEAEAWDKKMRDK